MWAKVVEQIALGEMPPKSQPRLKADEVERILDWIRSEQARAGRDVTPDPRQLPGFGNYVDHASLFTMPAERKAATPARLWRISPYIFKDQVNALSRKRLLLVKPNQGSDAMHPALPFLTPAHSFRDQAAVHTFENATTELLFDMSWRVAGLQLSNSQGRPKEFTQVQAINKITTPRLEPAIRMQFALTLQREPTAEEMKSLTELAYKTEKDAGMEEALQTVFAAVLMKPEALFRSEAGGGQPDQFGRVMLSPRELTFALGFALTDVLPSEELRKQAAAGKLQSVEDVRREVKRMLDYGPLANPRVLRFFQEYFEYPKVTQVFKDARGANAIFAHDRVLDADRLIMNVLKVDHDVLKELLTTDKLYVFSEKMPSRAPPQKRARQEYLPDFGFPSEWNPETQQPVKPPIGKRSGILTHPAWLLAFSDNEKNQAVQRGHWVRTKLLGGTIPDVPIGVNAQFPDDHSMTLRQKMHVTREEYCWKCHQRMDELGLPFEQFDDFGRWRTTERVQTTKADTKSYRNVPLDTTGQINLTGDPELDGPVKDPSDYMQRLANSRRVRQVFIRHAFRYWMGRNETLDDAPTLIDAEKAYDESGGSMKALLVSLLSSDSFLYRRLPANVKTSTEHGDSR